jgi:type I restriction enzyme R subunit
MSNQTNEKAFESYVEEILLSKGWNRGTVSEWDKECAFFPARILRFIADSQPDLWEQMRGQHAENLEPMLLKALVKELEIKGSLHALRHGFKFYGKTFKLAYFKPAHGLNPEMLELFAKNELTVTRQIPCHPGDHSTVDLVFAVNGLPVATCELKNPATGQTWRNAVKQYRADRKPNAPLFAFKKRALVHFAADPDEVHMCTRLSGNKSFFLPFNRGSHPGETVCGAGNPQHPSGYRTGYFWEEVLESDSFFDILGHFLFIERKEEKQIVRGESRLVLKETMIFPRYHQLDSTRKLIAAARNEGPGKNYLIQHSAGSGKTNSISWLSHQLASLHNGEDKKIFDCVVVITDRQVLDRQLQDAIYQIEHAQGVVKCIDQDSKQLAEALVDGTKIVITTLQKFPFVLRGLLHVAGADDLDNPYKDTKDTVKAWELEIARRRYAVIVDEAHSSQTGETARELKMILGGNTDPADDDAEPDWEDRLNQVMESRGRQPNLSFFAYTATPKGKTLELFGQKQTTGFPAAFHLYSMRQAIEERFILDVVKNYTTYKTYFKLVKSIEDDPDLPQKKASRALGKFLMLHPSNIEQKIEVIVEHFRSKVSRHLGGRAKAMVVTSSRLQAIKYMEAFERYIKEHAYKDIRPLVAFSGTVKDPKTGTECTEPGMNIDVVSGKPISEKQLPERFASPDYQVLLVANKYQTGFDQPLLMAMYVDKRLDGVQAVQTLSRLNRMVSGKEDPFVLDFVNEADDIYKAFKPYYDATSLQETSQPGQLEQLKHDLDQFQVYHWAEVEAFCQIYYRNPDRQTPSDHAHMQKHLQPAVDRFLSMEDEKERGEFRDKLSGYVKVYSFLSQIMPYCDSELEMLYSFCRMLLPHLPLDRNTDIVKLDDEVGLQYYRLQRIFSGTIELKEGEAGPVKSPTEVGTGKAKDEKAPLSAIIDLLNEKLGTNFTEEDRLFFEQIKKKATNHPMVIQLRQANPFDKFQLGLRSMLEDLMIQRMGENDKIVTRYMDDKAFEKAAFSVLSKVIYDAIPATCD